MSTKENTAIRALPGCEAPSSSVKVAHRPGEIIGDRYRLVRVIGEGAMGVVWETAHVELGQSVAVKILADDARSPSSAARFEREALAASRIEHPAVVRVLDFGRLPSGVPFLVMEHLAGETLEDVLARRGTLSLGEACEWLRPIASALDAAHALGIVHRDVKPANILTTPTPHGPRITLIDFGLAVRPGWDRLTGPGAILGTPAYLAPEAAAGRPTDARADVYALGCILFKMLTGRVPHERKTIVATLVAKLGEPATRLSEASDGPVPEALDALVARTLAIDPELRPASAGQLMLELVRIAEGRARPLAPPRVDPSIEAPAIVPAPLREGIAKNGGRCRPAVAERRSLIAFALVAAAVALVTLFAWTAGAERARAGSASEPLAKSAPLRG